MKYTVKENRFQSEAICNNAETAIDIATLFVGKYRYDKGIETLKVTIEVEREEGEENDV